MANLSVGGQPGLQMSSRTARALLERPGERKRGGGGGRKKEGKEDRERRKKKKSWAEEIGRGLRTGYCGSILLL